MTVGELKGKLKDLPDDSEVIVWDNSDAGGAHKPTDVRHIDEDEVDEVQIVFN